MNLDFHFFTTLLSICYFLFGSIFFLFKKKSKKDSIVKYLLMLPNLINQAEKLFNDGSDKLNYVLSILYATIKNDGVTDATVINYDFKTAIEAVLSTPHKKESDLNEA